MSYVNTITKPAYYNEFDPAVAQWLRNLVAAGHIAPGEVDGRSIEDVSPADLRGFTQCHFFAGVGVWSLALRRAGVSDDTPIWTGSCPCQPFSAAGKGAGMDDQRHLWPHWHHLIAQCSPAEILGEQVASKDAEPWLDLVQDDLEGMGYAVGAVPFPSAGVGAPHIRDRLYWAAKRMAHAHDTGLEGWGGVRERAAERLARAGGVALRLAHADGGNAGAEGLQRSGQHGQQPEDGGTGGVASTSRCVADTSSSGRGEERPHAGGSDVGDRQEGFSAGPVDGRCDCGLADSDGERLPEQHVCARAEDEGGRHQADLPEAGRRGHLVLVGGERADRSHVGALPASAPAGPVNGFWADSDWLLCWDGKWRPVEPGSFPLAHGAASRVVRLRAYGNSLNAYAAEAFIRSYFEARATGSAGLVDAGDLRIAA